MVVGDPMNNMKYTALGFSFSELWAMLFESNFLFHVVTIPHQKRLCQNMFIKCEESQILAAYGYARDSLKEI